MTTSKRSRATYEADLQAQQSPFVIYGTPLPPLDPAVRDDGSYVPIWKQEVTDDRGRKRLHGAFTGGFSAGYFNTVGSKEGWTPSTFVSSRSSRKTDADRLPPQRPEDFMDEEDLADAAAAQRLQTTGSFAGLGLTGEAATRRDRLMDVLKVDGETMGVKLLRKMGWKDGQGIGPKVRRKPRGEDDDGSMEGTYMFAPENSSMVRLTRKNDHKGLGYEGEARLGGHDGKVGSGRRGGSGDDEDEIMTSSKVGKKPKRSQNGAARGGFGVGILNDTGSDDEDPYEIGPRIKYNKVIGGGPTKKKTKSTPSSSESARVKANAANPLVRTKPVFISKKASALAAKPGFRKCHDGRLPLDGFVLSTTTTDDVAASVIGPADKRYPPPEIPKDWKSAKKPSPSSSSDPTSYQSTADVARASTLDPKSRAALLGETQLPGPSVFRFLSAAARDRIAAVTGRTDLPPGLGEGGGGGGGGGGGDQKTSALRDLVPHLDRDVALKALGRGVAGWMPYADDASKRARYRAFLESKAGLPHSTDDGLLPPEPGLVPPAAGMSTDDWVNELREFAHAAQLFKPMTGLMASRFTTSSSSSSLSKAPQPATSSSDYDDGGSGGGGGLLRDPSSSEKKKPEDPAEAAAQLGMYGPMTRSMQLFHPTRLLCKRFNVKPPTHVQADPAAAAAAAADSGVPTTTTTTAGAHHPSSTTTTTTTTTTTSSTTLPTKSLELLSKAAVDDILRDSQLTATTVDINNKNNNQSPSNPAAIVVLDPQTNPTLEAERPGDAVFKAIFGDDDDDDDDDGGGGGGGA